MNHPARVRVVHPRTDAIRRAPARAPLREIDEQTELGDVYMSALIRSQRRLAVSICATVAALLAATALAGAVAPGLDRVRLLGVPVLWAVLGVFVYPGLIALGWYTVRASERNERLFTTLVGRR